MQRLTRPVLECVYGKSTHRSDIRVLRIYDWYSTIYRYGYYNGYNLTGFEGYRYHVLRPENRKTEKNCLYPIFVWVSIYRFRPKNMC